MAPNLVENSDRYNEKYNEWRVRGSTRRSTRRSTRTVPTSESAAPTSDDGSIASHYISSGLASTGCSSTFGSFASMDLAPLRRAEPINCIPDEVSEISAATTTNFCGCFRNTNRSQTEQLQKRTRQQDIEWEAQVIFNEIYRRCWEALEQKHSAKNQFRPLSYIPCSVTDEMFDRMQDIHEDKPLDQLRSTEFCDLFIDARRTNRLHIPYNLPSSLDFLIIDSLKISEIEINSTEKLARNTRSYTFGVVSSENKIRKTNIEESDSERVVFASEFCFDRLSYDFQIRLQFFQCRAKDKRRSWKRFFKRSVEEPIKFELLGEATISREHLTDGYLLHLHEGERENVSIEAKVTAKVRSLLKLQECLHYATYEDDSVVQWACNERWCELDDTYIWMWLRDDMRSKPPIKLIDLSKAKCVRRPYPHESPRKYSMIIEVVQDSKVDKIYLSHKKKEVIDRWIETIRIVKDAKESFNC